MRDLTTDEIPRIEAEAVAAMETSLAGVRQLDVGMAMAPYHPTQTAYAWTNVPLDYSETVATMEGLIEGLESAELDFVSTKVRVLSRDAAVVQGIYETTQHLKDGTVLSMPDRGTWMCLMERFDEGWKITMSANSFGEIKITGEG
jgi:hypothetical protein